jgi:lipopolysaccharide transport system permease protein
LEKETEHWDLIIRPRSSWLDVRFKDIVRYRDLLFLFVRRDFVSLYKQTILGPVWFFLQPVITMITFTLVFGGLAKISTDGVPKPLFYLAGITLWNYFSETLTKTADTFSANASIFGKVYFPRIIVPLSIVFSNLIKLGIQMLLFIIVWLFYLFTTEGIHPNAAILLLPLLVLVMGLLGLASGILITSMTTKYRDLRFLITFGVQLLMYGSPIVFPLSIVPEKYKWLIALNPVTSIIEAFKYGFLGVGELNWFYLTYTLVFTLFLLLVGMFIFTRMEKSFMDTV